MGPRKLGRNMGPIAPGHLGRMGVGEIRHVKGSQPGLCRYAEERGEPCKGGGRCFQPC